MQAALRPLDRRALGVVGVALLATIVAGVVAARSPILAVGLIAGATLAVVMISNLTLGVVVFTVFSFAYVLTSGSGGTSAKALGGILVVAWVAQVAFRPPADRRSFLADNRALAACAVGLVAWSAMSAVWAQGSGSTALLGASRFAQVLVLLPILYAGVTRLKHVRWVALAFAVGATLAMLYGVVTNRTVDGSRLIGAVGDPNEAAAVLVAAAVLFLALGIGARGKWRGAAFATAVVALFGMAATGSRGGLVALIATAIAAVVIAGQWRRQIATAAAVGGVLVVAWFAFLAPASTSSHVSTLSTPRTTLWKVAGRAIAANPVVGVGTDNFALTAKNYLVQPGATTRADQILTTPEPAHNTYLEIFADTGIVGLAIFAGLILAALHAAWKAVNLLREAGRWRDELVARGVIVATIAMLAAGFFISDQYSKSTFLLLALGPALLGAARRDVRFDSPTSPVSSERR